MTDGDGPTMRGLADGGAELAVVLRLRWDDVAALGREASRLAEQRGAPVTLDEAASHRLRTWSSVSKSQEEKGQPAAISGGQPTDRTRSQVASISPPTVRPPQSSPTALGQTPA
ncbi:hypothetical protein [Streptomyces sp. I6]|uniref:hypothetical protein n=2 Tax=unclassified Streptomyces TaxID=2593676 RepID=UPI0037DA1331